MRGFLSIAIVVFSLVGVHSIYAQKIPVAFWNFDEGTSTEAADSVNNLTADLSDGTMWSNSLIDGSCLYFSDSSKRVNLSNSEFDIDTEISIMFWMRSYGDNPDVYYEEILSRGRYSNPFAFTIINNYTLNFKLKTEEGQNTLNSTTKLAPGMWYYVALTYNSKYVALYVNGMLEDTSNTNGIIVFGEDMPLLLGGNEYAFNGKLDELRIYDVALSQEELNAVMNYRKDVHPPSVPETFTGYSTYSHSIELKWNGGIDNSEEAVSYNLYRNNVLQLKTKELTYLDDSLTANTSYTYHLATLDRFGNESEKVELIVTTLAQGETLKPIARFILEPGTEVEVGEPIYFDAWDTTDDQPLAAQTINGPEATFMWSFGDGTEMRGNVKPRIRYGSGPSVLHFYMNPGVYPAKLIVEDSDGNRDSVIHEITVTGEAPVEGFELWHAPFNCRIAQNLFAQIPDDYINSGNYSLKLTLTSDKGYSSVLVEKTNLKNEEIIFLQNSELPAGNYTLITEIINSAQECVSIIKEKFPKPYDGMPRVGIDENNATCVNGEPVFLLKPWIQNKPDLAEWAGKYVNCSKGEGWYPEHNIDSWKDYLDFSQEHGLWSMGPVSWDGAGVINSKRKSNIRNAIKYIEATKDHPSLYAWEWFDEPNIGGGQYALPAKVGAAFAYKCRTLDPYHVVWNGFYGFDYIDAHEPEYYAQFGFIREYDYLYNADFFGGKKYFAHDITSFDIYPIEFQFGHRLVDDKRGPIDHWVSAMDNMIARNYDLIPACQSIAVSNVGDGHKIYQGGPDPTPMITPSQLKMEIWLCIAHNMKGINWFQYFQPMTDGNLAEMEEFYKDMENYQHIILGAASDYIVIDNANERGRRVDFCVREDEEFIYVFAVRLTEPESEYNEVEEVASITVNFNIDGLMEQNFEVLKEDRTLVMTAGSFSDTFGREQVHIYKIRKDISDTETILDDNLELKCTPNPTNGRMFVNFELENTGYVVFDIVDLQGKRVLLKKFIANSGHNIINVNQAEWKESLPGIYICRLKTAQKQEKVRVVKF